MWDAAAAGRGAWLSARRGGKEGGREEAPELQVTREGHVKSSHTLSAFPSPPCGCLRGCLDCKYSSNFLHKSQPLLSAGAARGRRSPVLVAQHYCSFHGYDSACLDGYQRASQVHYPQPDLTLKCTAALLSEGQEEFLGSRNAGELSQLRCRLFRTSW